MDLIATACDHLARKESTQALKLLVETWRERPLSRLANLIDALDGEASKLRIDARSHDAWMARAHGGRTEDLGALLAALAASTPDETLTRLKALEPFGRDPRIATALLGFLKDSRYLPYPSRPMWTLVFARLTDLEDLRVLDKLPSVRASWATQSEAQRAWLEARAHKLVTMLGQRRRVLPNADDTAALDALARELAKLGPKGGVDEMLAQVYKTPADDKLRLVYADHLQERGDPRGELIMLQLQKERTRDMIAHEKTLIEAHLTALVGALLPVLVLDAQLTIERGFLSRCTVRFRNERDVRMYGSRAAWATVERLAHALGPDAREGRKWHRWIDPAMKSLRDVDVFPESVPNLCTAPEPWLIERMLWCPDSDVEAERMLAATDKLPRLRTLDVTHTADLAWLTRARFAPQVRELRVVNAFRGGSTTVDTVLAAASGLPNVEHVGLGLDDRQELTFVRDAKGIYSIIQAGLDPSSLWSLAGAIRNIPPGALTEVDIAADPRVKRNFDVQGFLQVREALSHHTLRRFQVFGKTR